MFLRFSKGSYTKEKKYLSTIRKGVFLGGHVVVECGDKIVGVAQLHAEDDRMRDYDIIVADKCPLGGDKIARYIKDMIGKSNKFAVTPSDKKRKYYVEKVDCDVLPIKAEIKLTRI